MARLNIELSATGVNEVGKGMRAAADGVAALEAKIKSLKSSIGEMSGLQMRLNAQMDAIKAQFQSGAISAQQYESSIERLSDDYYDVTQSIRASQHQMDSLQLSLKRAKDATDELSGSQSRLTTVHSDFKYGTDAGQSSMIRYAHAQRATLSASNNLAKVMSEVAAGGQGVASSLGVAVRQMATAAISGGGLSATFRGLGAALMGPAGIVIAISAAVTVLTNYIARKRQAAKATKEASEATRDYAKNLGMLSKTLYDAAQSYGRDIARMNTLMSVLNSATATQKQRNAALKELQGMYPQVFKNYNTETILTEKASEAYKELTASIIASANAHAAQAMIADKAKQQWGLVLENSERQEQLEITEAQIEADKRKADGLREYLRINKDISSDERDQLLRDADALDRSIKSNDKILQLRQEQTDAAKEISDIEIEKNKLQELALDNQLKVNDALLDTGKNTDKATASGRDFVDAIARVFDFETSSASLINVSYTNAEIQKVENEYKKMLNNVDRLEREGLKRKESYDGEHTRIVEEGIRQRAEIQRAQAIAVADVIYRQETVAIEKSLQEQRDLYENYENWRLELGEEAANKRYEAELESVRGFYARLESEMAGLMMKSMGVEGLNDAEKDRLDALTKIFQDFNKDREAEENKHLMSLLKLYGTFEDNRKRLAEQYYKDIESLNEEQRKNRARKYADDLAKDIEDEIENSDAFRNMDIALDFSGIRKSKEAVKLAKDFLDDFFANLKPTSAQEEAAADQLQRSLNRSLKKIDVALDAKAFDVVTDLVTSFGDLVDSAQDFGESLGKSLKTVGSMVSEVGNMAKSLGSVMGEAGAGLGKLGGWAGIAGAVIGVVGGISGAIEQIQARKVAEQAERMQKQNEQSIRVIDSMTKSLQRQLEVIELIYGIERVTEWQRVSNEAAASVEKSLAGMSDIIAQNGSASGAVEALRRFGLGTVSELDKEIERLEKRIKRNQWNPFANTAEDQMKLLELKSIKTLLSDGVIPPYEYGWDKISDITQEGAEQIRKDIEEGKFDEVTAKELSSMLDEWQIYMNAQRKLVEELTGTPFEALGDGLVDIFTRGDSAMEDFEKNFDELIRKSLVQSLKRSIMTDALKDWYEQFASFAESDGGLDEREVEELRKSYEQIGEQIKANAENLERATGISLSPDDSDSVKKGLTGSIQRLSEQTGSELTGLYRAGFELNKQELGYVQRLAISNDGILLAINESSEYLSDIASTNAEIAENTAYLEEIAESLNQVAKNTGGKSQRDLG